ncbi:uncharacterized protein ELE39_001988 [Cryptosporidium sp. chipmunk genotype I]|uniref:uncharacterized protein n=1 Tax=Cryptosporidium sp. chipmunk genotype I TaxID=1280935 RepID=UPI00351A314C|nr:hypothetical protein ELE39_001988 [Cryptosporidium sp. chipmunk genotype I]
MDSEFNSFEWFDAISRQGSKLSRTSFNTAKTDYSIYFECSEFEEYIENEIELSRDESKEYCDCKKSITIKLPEIIPRSKTKSTYKSDACFKFSNKYNKGKLYEKNRSKTTPYKKYISGIIDNTSSDDFFFIEHSGNEFVDNSILSSNILSPKIKLKKEGNNFQTTSSENGLLNSLNDIKPFPNSTDSQIENYFFIESFQDIENHRKKRGASFQEFCHSENDQSLKSFETKLDNGRSPIETRLSNSFTVRKSFNGKATSTVSTFRTTDSTLSIEKNKNINKKLYIDLPTIFLEGETDINRKNSRSNCILSTFLNCKNICCLVD